MLNQSIWGIKTLTILTDEQIVEEIIECLDAFIIKTKS